MTFWELSPAFLCCGSGQCFLSREPQSEGFLFSGGGGCVRGVNGDTQITTLGGNYWLFTHLTWSSR